LEDVNADDGLLFLAAVATDSHTEEKKYSYTYKRVGNNGKDKNRPFKVNNLFSILNKPGKYLLLCSNRMLHTKKYQALMKRLKNKSLSEYERYGIWSKVRHPERQKFVRCQAKHAVAVVVHDDMSRKLYDNGLRDGVADFTVEKLAQRVGDVAVCYAFDISEIVN
jgi:hypothetical protein